MARRASGAAGQPRDLVRMRQRLDEWRAGHSRGVVFPAKLWSAAGRVAQRHGVFRAARALGLEYNKLKRASGEVIGRVGGEARRPPTAKPMKFIEVTGVLPASPSGCRLSLQHANGQRLQLEMAPSAATEVVLQLTRKQRAAALADDADGERTGIFTSGIVATHTGHQVALFFTGVRHAGENLAAVLARRNTDLPAPIQMCDGLSRNIPSEFDTILSQCLAHARRRYVELTETFPAEVRFVLETLREVYIIDARARDRGLGPAQRLQLHQDESQPRMAALEQWMQRQFDERLIEPNSALGAAILYMQKRWSELTLFLRVEGAPLDNNTSERALKKAILHRKNALFYRTLAGAHVGDVFMSLIHTAELNHIAPFQYLVALQRHATTVAANPAHWMPWNYQTTLAQNNAGPDPPA